MNSRNKKTTRGVALAKRQRGVNVCKWVTLFLFTIAFCLRVSPAFAVDEAEFACNGADSGIAASAVQG